MVTGTKKMISRKSGRILVIFFLVISALGFIQANIAIAVQPLDAVSEEAGPEAQKKLKTASMQHELILLLIENKTFDQVELQWKKVLDLRLNARYEGAIAQSLLMIGYKLFEAKQFVPAQKIMDASLASVPFTSGNKADIFKFKAALYKEMGDLDNAIRFMRLASELSDK